MTEIYVSTDIEADGPIPGRYSMLSYGSAAFDSRGKVISTFSENLKPLPGAKRDPKTMAWWATQKDAWGICQQNQQDPKSSMKRYYRWLKTLPGQPIFVAYPASYDFTFIYWYLINFLGESPFKYHALDMKTLTMAVLGTTFEKTKLPRQWQKDVPQLAPHIALNDAIVQGHIFFRILSELKMKK